MKQCVFGRMVFVLTVLAVFAAGCATEYASPLDRTISKVNVGDPIFQFTRQASIPASSVYRTVWPVATVTTVSTNKPPRPKSLSIPLLSTIITAVTEVYSAVVKSSNSTVGSIYRYREDVLLTGTNVTVDNIRSVLRELNRPNLDAQRDGWLPADY